MIKDWKGNEILEGHTIQVVKTREPEQSSTFGLLDLRPGGKFTELSRYEVPAKEYLWDIERELLVVNPIERNEDGSIAIIRPVFEKEISINQLFNLIFGFPHDGYIICITGISDNRDEYYLDKFSL